MWFILEKIASSLLVLPGLFVTLAIVLGIVLRRERRSSCIFYILACVLYLLTTGLGARYIATSWERAFSPVPPGTAQERAIVILGGGSLYDAETLTTSPGPYTLLRCLAAFRLYQDRPLPVVVSGGSLRGSDSENDANIMKAILLDWGIPKRDIMVEDQSLTTWENARYTVPILELLDAEHFFLVTSGLHLRRALFAFHEHIPGAVITPIRAHLSYDLVPLSLVDFLPSRRAFNAVSQAIQEMIGYLFYRLIVW
ncbi:MAG TPA: YdcF family protein [Atribacteraceae bacterium]|nr:YdcF family protein [Atribacteraceae bacterium]